ncbi:galactose-1-phosphate uridylyltransferase [Nocardiopsis sp. MG754419]|uniref:galactose-1-phosphate uridylyltransferase n=1 Tax=Nocardiopsis sp. MG754419 TaxID=2259865 RepID=UPI001BA8688E|nr:galactose-1-phosphate uridylyltransferase [Nocardiopsis sp. MG754419]MBR8743646.1 galactose-1-phosphate uridylyltransferase [Nocardiopsis sp. MG754419]
MRKTSARLADGREIIYFDESDGARRELHDHRDLPERAPGSELRRDPLTREWVVVAAHRQGRTHLPPSDQCPLCPSTGDRRTEVPSADYDVVAFENRFPSLSGDEGRCEVLCFSSDHDTSLAELGPRRVRTIVDAWADRSAALAERPGIEQVYCFENRGPEIGVTLHHPHGQIYALPFVTPRTATVLASARAHREETGGDLFEDVLAAERKGPRVVLENEHWTAFVPEAARWPVEVHVYPHRAVPDLPSLDDAERDAFAELYSALLGRCDRLFDGPLPYISAWHQAPVRDAEARDLSRLRLELFSVRRAAAKLKYLAGTESGMGVFINDIAPETTAQRLREAAP